MVLSSFRSCQCPAKTRRVMVARVTNLRERLSCNPAVKLMERSLGIVHGGRQLPEPPDAWWSRCRASVLRAEAL